MNKIISLSLIIGLIAVSCTDPNIIGLEVQPTSDNIIISNTSSFNWQTPQTESEDSLITSKSLNLVLGEISDPVFGYNQGAFNTQILLSKNNNTLGENAIVDSVVLSYTYSGFYGSQLPEFTNIEVKRIYEDIYKDSIYYSNEFPLTLGSPYWVDTFSLSNDSEIPFLKIKLDPSFVQDIFKDNILKDNETFLQEFKGISVLASSTNTILYLNPYGSNSFMKIYYHNDESGNDTLSLDFELGGDAARVNWFNKKYENPENNILITNQSKIYIQSMAGYKSKISITNKDSIKSLLEGKAINKVTMSFDVETGSQDEYAAHDKLFLVRVNQEGDNIFLTDFTVEGETHFGGRLEDDKYEFNITRYFAKFLNNDLYTNDLYLLPAGALINANRTILNKNIKLQIYYSE